MLGRMDGRSPAITALSIGDGYPLFAVLLPECAPEPAQPSSSTSVLPALSAHAFTPGRSHTGQQPVGHSGSGSRVLLGELRRALPIDRWPWHLSGMGSG